MSHTPGPWRTTKLGASVLAGKTTIAHIEHVGLDETRMANAQLTAAAPDLLAACEAVVTHLAQSSGFEQLSPEDQLRAEMSLSRKLHIAIKKAKGL